MSGKTKTERAPEITDEDSQDESRIIKIAKHPRMNTRQVFMLVLFMIIEFFYGILTLGLGPIGPSIQKVYKASEGYMQLLQLTPILAAIVGFYPTFKILNKFGLKTGFGLCLVFSFVGSFFELLIDISPYFFFAGHLLILIGMQSIHTAKGLFVNIFFEERNVRGDNEERTGFNHDGFCDASGNYHWQRGPALACVAFPSPHTLRRRHQGHSQGVHLGEGGLLRGVHFARLPGLLQVA